jgi:hypothetical protein
VVNNKKTQRKKKIFVRSGIRTHALRRGLRPERSALDHSAIRTVLLRQPPKIDHIAAAAYLAGKEKSADRAPVREEGKSSKKTSLKKQRALKSKRSCMVNRSARKLYVQLVKCNYNCFCGLNKTNLC